MNVRVTFWAQVRTAAGLSEAAVTLPENSTVSDLLLQLGARHGAALQAFLFHDDGRPRATLLVAVNEAPIHRTDWSTVRLSAGDHVALVPPVAGG